MPRNSSTKPLPSTPDPNPSAIKLANLELEITTTFSDQTTTGSPIDGGHKAWRLLLSAFVFESLLWGFPLSFGVFQEHYTRIQEFRNSPYISIVGTTASGISYLGAPFVVPFIRRWSKYRTHMILVGWPLFIIGLGVLYGIGFIIFYYPILSMVDEYWIRRRGMAYGLLCSASGVSGAVTPLSLQALLKQYGHRTTLRGVAVFLFVVTGPLIPLLKGRPGQKQNRQQPTHGTGRFFPALFLPSYASSIGLSTSKGALLLALMSVSQIAGQFTFGYLSDKRTSVNALITVSVSIAAIATLSAWGLARSIAPLILFALLYGFFGAGYTAMWARMATAVSEEPSAAQAIFGMFNFGKGVGNIAAGPISAGLLR
ncbi:MFS general substrate transporter [Macroventuria anomochaeta]|uniref:MFS general substrate transporter n=1 Tax=Macroventuria anomochaeta TaxID=301207 RepID=A0ACB6RQP2_9PLEO|nr:MFS general substrate transporter [Macroventuria anomochaeta]KAF2624211.1 MFS general substrate transporter [Macroventuria anomochaeta]